MARFLLAHPADMEWREWADAFVGYSPELATVMDPGGDWRELADQLALFIGNAPVADLFESWQEWVSALNLILETQP